MNIDWSKIEIDERFRGVVEVIRDNGGDCSCPYVRCGIDCPLGCDRMAYGNDELQNTVELAKEYIRRLDNAKIDTVPISLRQLNHICNGYVDLCKLGDDMADSIFELSESLDIKFDESKDEYLKRKKADLVESFFNKLKEVNGG